MSRSVILVTGASRGLGRGVALALAREGHDVAIHYASNRAAADETASLCAAAARDPAQRFVPVAAELAAAPARQACIDAVLAAYGRIDGLVNNAGIAPRVRADITAADEASFDEVLAVNLRGPYFLTQLVARWWLAHPGEARLPGGYTLVFVTSISAHTASVARGDYLGIASDLNRCATEGGLLAGDASRK